MLTHKQKQLLDFITAEIEKTGGVSPSFDEMMAHMDLKSKSGVHRLVSALCERGHLVRMKNRARCLRLPEHVIKKDANSEALMQIDGIIRDYDNYAFSMHEAFQRIRSVRTFHMGGV